MLKGYHPTSCSTWLLLSLLLFLSLISFHLRADLTESSSPLPSVSSNPASTTSSASDFTEQLRGDSEGQKLANKIAVMTRTGVYNLDNDQLLAVLESFLIDTPSIKGLRITESVDQEVLISFFRRDDQLVYQSNLPEEVEKLESFRSDIFYDNESLGFVELYYRDTPKQRISLTEEEQQWLFDHPEVGVALPEDDFFPALEGTLNSRNFFQELMVRLSVITGINFRYQLVSDARQRAFENPDISIQPIYHGHQHIDQALVTDAVMKVDYGLYGLNEGPDINSVQDLNGLSISVSEQHLEHLKHNPIFDDSQLVISKNIAQAIRQLNSNDVALVYYPRVITDSYIKAQSFSDQIQLNTFDQLDQHNLALSVSADDIHLYAILQKALASVSEDEYEYLYQSWRAGQQQGTVPVFLSPEELAWLKQNPVISVGLEEWFPFIHRKSDGTAGGIAGDFLNLIQQKTGLKYRMISEEWHVLLSDFKQGNIDLLPATYYTQERATYGLYSPAYFSAKEFLYINQSNRSIQGFNDLKDKTLAIVKGYGTIPKIRQKFPEIQLLETKSQLESIYAVLNGKADALYESQIVIEDLLRKELIIGLQAIAQNDFEASFLHLFSRQDSPILQSILSKALDDISTDERSKIVSRWIVQAEEQQVPKEAETTVAQETSTTELPSDILHWVLLALLLFLLLTLFLPRLLDNDHLARYFGTASSRVVMLSVMSVMIILISVLVWQTLEKNKNLMTETIRGDLIDVRESTLERLFSWIEERKKMLTRMGQDPALQQITVNLLSTDYQESVPGVDIYSSIYHFFYVKNNEQDWKSYQIVSPQGRILTSGNAAIVGQYSAVFQQTPEIFQAVLNGQSMFGPPVYTREQGANNSRPDSKPLDLSLFFAAPIRGQSGSVIALLVKQLPLQGQLSSIMQAGRIGQSGESYLINRKGLLLTESRFQSQLYDLKLLNQNKKRIYVRDPGGNIVDGYQPELSRSQMPLTLMAQDMMQIAGEIAQSTGTQSVPSSSNNIVGYRDYRGTLVFGAWKWEETLGMGIVTEVDVDEAMKGYYSMRMSLLAITGITLLMTIAALQLTLALGDRATRVMRRVQDELEERVIERTQALEVSETKTRAIIENAQDAIIVIDEKSQISVWNNAAQKVFGYSTGEMRGQTIERIVPPRFHSNHENGFHQALRSGFTQLVGSDAIELVGLHKQGYEIAIEMSLSRFSMGDTAYFSASIRDITERKKNEMALRLAEEKNRLLLTSVGQGLFGVDQNGEVNFINPAASQMLGYEEGEIIGQKVHPLIHHTKADGSHYPVEECPMYHAFTEGLTSTHDDEVLWRKDGTFFPVEYTSRPITKGDEIIGSVVVFSDITQRKESELDLQKAHERLKSSEELLDIAMKAASLGLWDFRPQIGALYINDGWAEMLGYQKSEISPVVEEWSARVHPDDMDETWALYGEHAAGNTEIYQSEHRLRTKQGHYKWILDIGRATERDEEGNPISVVGIHMDIDESKEAQLALAKAKQIAEDATQAKSDFLANMSHEIRTPMNAIIGMSHLALQTDLSRKQRNYVEKVNRSAESLLGIINDILDFSKIEAGKLDIEHIEFRLEDVFDNLANLVGLKAEEKGLELMFDLPNDTPMALLGDPLRLGQILTNLGNNAVKFTERGEIVVRVEVREDADDTALLHFSVRDSGIGMDQEQQAKLFRSFSQADSSTTRKYGGTGLGLVISKKLTEMMSGEIWVDSEVGLGSTFHFTARFDKQQGAVSKRRSVASELGAFRVLVIDDNPSACEILSAMLAGFGLRVDQVSDGQSAISKLEEANQYDPYKLIITDWKMPGMDGIETIRHIQTKSELTEIPTVIMVTAYGREDAAQASQGVNINAFLTKPVTASTMLDAIMQAMGCEGAFTQSEGVRHSESARAIEQLQGARILLVEDNEINQELAEELLSSNGLLVTLACDGQQALNILQQQTFDGVLMDCQMPVMDGYTATRQVRQVMQLEELPILAMTANAMAGDREKVLDAGMNDHIAKPINVNAMFQTMAKWITPAIPVEKIQSSMSSQPVNEAETEALVDLSLPDLAGIDKTLGLEHAQNNQTLYVKLLNKVAKNQGDFVAQYQDALELQDWDCAERLAHTLKGVSGSIGAEKLHQSAAQLEQDAKERTHLEANWQQVCDDHAEMMQGLLQLQQWRQAMTASAQTGTGQDQSAGGKQNPQGISVETISQMKTVLERLHEQLEEYDTEAADTLDEHHELLDQPQLKAEVKGLEKAIEGYDFDSAQQHLEQLQVLIGQLEATNMQYNPASSGQDISVVANALDQDGTDQTDLDKNSLDKSQVEKKQLLEVVELVQQQISEYDTEVADTLDEHHDLLHSQTNLAVDLKALYSAIDSYDFEGAEAHIEQIKQKLTG